MESVLFRLANEAAAAEAFRSDPAQFLQAYNLESRERDMLHDLDLEGMAALPLNWMLLIGAFQAVRGRAARGEYLDRLRPFVATAG